MKQSQRFGNFANVAIGTRLTCGEKAIAAGLVGHKRPIDDDIHTERDRLLLGLGISMVSDRENERPYAEVSSSRAEDTLLRRTLARKPLAISQRKRVEERQNIMNTISTDTPKSKSESDVANFAKKRGS